MLKIKVDIYKVQEIGKYSSKREYYGSIIFETKKEINWVLDYLHHANGTMSIEGIEIKSFILRSYALIQITDFCRDGEFFRNLIYENKHLLISNIPFPENEFIVDDDDIEYLIIDGENNTELLTEENFSFLHDYEHNSIKSEYIFKLGASGLWENYLIGIASSFTVEIITKLISLGFSSNNIKKHKLPSKIKNLIAKEYNIYTDSLFLESLKTDDFGISSLSFRGLEFRFQLKVNNDQIISLETEKLNKYL